jgi:hypothetical protein
MSSSGENTLRLAPGARAVHRHLSAVHERFLDFVERHPECLARSTFATIDDPAPLTPFPMQSWPTFVSRQTLARMGAVAVNLCRLVKSIPERVFGRDPGRIAGFYGMEREFAEVLVTVLDQVGSLEPLVARGDFIGIGDGAQCLEYNFSSDLTGWATKNWVDRYLRVAVIREFLAEERVETSYKDPMHLFFEHAVADIERRLDPLPPEVNVFIALHPGEQVRDGLIAYANEEYRSFLQRTGRPFTGEVLFLPLAELRSAAGAVEAGGKVVHVLVDRFSGRLAPAVFAHWLDGSVLLYNGPFTKLLGDKRNLALLSEQAEAGGLSHGEARLVAKHVPWTRVVADKFTSRNGKRHYVPDVLLEHREELVLKAASSYGGLDVVIGRWTAPGEWERRVDEALEEGFWIAQDWVEPPSYLYRCGNRGCALHHVVWGLFVYGPTYAGGCLRMTPTAHQKVVNSTQGAEEGIFFEV